MSLDKLVGSLTAWRFLGSFAQTPRPCSATPCFACLPLVSSHTSKSEHRCSFRRGGVASSLVAFSTSNYVHDGFLLSKLSIVLVFHPRSWSNTQSLRSDVHKSPWFSETSVIIPVDAFTEGVVVLESKVLKSKGERHSRQLVRFCPTSQIPRNSTVAVN